MTSSTSEGEQARTERMERAGSAIASFLDTCGYTDRFSAHRAIALWSSVVQEHLGPEAAKAALAREIRNGELVVVVSKAAWRHRLTFETPRLIQELNDRLGSESVSSIRLV